MMLCHGHVKVVCGTGSRSNCLGVQVHRTVPAARTCSSRKPPAVACQCHGGPRPIHAPPRLRSSGGGRKRMVVVQAAGDYYDLLGVSKDADKKAVKAAYRSKARVYHPDVNKEPGAEETFKKIGEAYEVLSDDDKRAVYDRFGEAGLKGGMGGMGGMGGAGDFTNPFDLFETFFGGSVGMRSQQASRFRAMPGDDERFDVQLEFLEAVFGCSREIEIQKLNTCGACDGSGMKAGTTATTCNTCNGQGQVMSSVRTPLGNFQQIATCPRCNGAGETFTPCPNCQGDGRVREKKRIQLRVPAGVDVGSRLRVRGEGGVGKRGGEAGDLYVYISVKEHPEMRREGMNIMSDIEVSYLDAILGSTVKVTTVDGAVELRIPPGTQPGTTLLMARRGVPRLGNSSQRGDHQVQVRVRIPKSLSPEEKKLVEELKELSSRSKGGPFRF